MELLKDFLVAVGGGATACVSRFRLYGDCIDHKNE